jgi:hypothetical protein
MRILIAVCLLAIVLGLAALEVVASHLTVEPLMGSPAWLGSSPWLAH